jgi:hypothetical protein
MRAALHFRRLEIVSDGNFGVRIAKTTCCTVLILQFFRAVATSLIGNRGQRQQS